MKKYKLKRDLPRFKAGDEFWIDGNGDLVTEVLEEDLTGETEDVYKRIVTVIPSCILEKFPNNLKDWFEEIPEAPKTVWDLKYEEDYWVINNVAHIILTCWDGDRVDERRRDMGNCFLAREDAEKELARCKAKQILLRDTKGFKPDWKDEDQFKYRVLYDAANDELGIEWQVHDVHSVIHFANEDDAKASIKVHEKEWKIYLGVDDE